MAQQGTIAWESKFLPDPDSVYYMISEDRFPLFITFFVTERWGETKWEERRMQGDFDSCNCRGLSSLGQTNSMIREEIKDVRPTGPGMLRKRADCMESNMSLNAPKYIFFALLCRALSLSLSVRIRRNVWRPWVFFSVERSSQTSIHKGKLMERKGEKITCEKTLGEKDEKRDYLNLRPKYLINLSSDTKLVKATSWLNSLIYFIENGKWLFIGTMKDVEN